MRFVLLMPGDMPSSATRPLCSLMHKIGRCRTQKNRGKELIKVLGALMRQLEKVNF